MVDSQTPKDRIYLAIYIRDGVSAHFQAEDRFRWAILAVSDHSAQATRCHARYYFTNRNQTHWIYEEIHVSARGTPKLLSQIYIGDIIDDERLFEILRDVPIKQEKGWNCVDWETEAIKMDWEDGLLQGGKLNRLDLLKSKALRAANVEVARREGVVKHYCRALLI
jgi:hypothetical protein